MELIDTLHEKYKIVSIIGMAKNAGKTVTLNKIIEDAYYEDINIGITSTGRDGECEDVVTSTEKPAIYIYEGNIIATTTGSIEKGDATVEILEVTNYRTSMGAIVLARIVDGGYIEIAGAQTASEMKQLSKRMLDYGAELVLVDGSINRIAVADPTVTEATILATGAVLSRNMDKVIEETIHKKTVLELDEVDNYIKAIIYKNIDNITIIDQENNIKIIDLKTSLNSGKIIGDNITEDTRYVYIPGCLVTSTLKDIVETNKYYKNIKILVRDGTKVFIPPMQWLRFKKKGIKINVLNKINLAAITLNPYSPSGYFFDAENFKEKMTSYVKDLPVYDVMM
ncbi:hypothetical protein [Senegalia sp. (in: firmicutes)]|uniref:lysine 5,6-aminomutase reactivase subunit KamB n=1 Tax=Senegalia sp. (in: firmicutes) TaxID=1924098 RepID=UPI003F94DF4B